MVLGVSVNGFIASEKAMTTGVVTATAVEPFAGEMLRMVGLDLSGVAEEPVLKLLVKVVATFPTKSVKPPTDTEYEVLVARATVGVKVRVVAFVRVTVPATTLPPAVTVMDELFTLTTLAASLRAT